MSRSRQQALYDEPADPVPSAGLPRLVRPRSEVAAQLGQRIIWESKYSVACLVYGVVGCDRPEGHCPSRATG
jgi:hypothetical protein